MVNGAMGAMAFLYGGGDFKRTVGIAIAAGFDCDNQAATLAGVVGVMHGARAIPHELTHQAACNGFPRIVSAVCSVISRRNKSHDGMKV